MNIIEINNLEVSSKKEKIFEIDNLILKSGEFLIINGKNGVGKTLFLKSLSGDIIFEKGLEISGSIKINNNEYLNNYNSEEIRKNICYIPQKDEYFTEKTVLEEFLLAFKLRLGFKSKEEVISFLIENAIDKVAPEIYMNLDKSPVNLSGGNQRLLTILIWLLSSQKANIYLVDEPLNNLDIYNVESVIKLFDYLVEKNPEAIILIVSHSSRFFEFVNGELLFDNNRVIKKSYQ